MIITPYNEHRELLETALDDLAQSHPGIVDVSLRTVRLVQGRESDVVIFSVGRNSPGGAYSLGICGEVNNVYVAVTRARKHFALFGDTRLLTSTSRWYLKVIDHARSGQVSPELL